eukprot:5927625-Amphidinium_carterae.1
MGSMLRSSAGTSKGWIWGSGPSGSLLRSRFGISGLPPRNSCIWRAGSLSLVERTIMPCPW